MGVGDAQSEERGAWGPRPSRRTPLERAYYLDAAPGAAVDAGASSAGERTFVLIFVDDLTMGCMVWEWQWGHRSVVHD